MNGWKQMAHRQTDRHTDRQTHTHRHCHTPPSNTPLPCYLVLRGGNACVLKHFGDVEVVLLSNLYQLQQMK